MSMDNTGRMGDGARDAGPTNSVTDAPLMATTPIWETRGRKGRGRATAAPETTPGMTTPTAAAAEPRSFDAPMDRTPERPIQETRPMTDLPATEARAHAPGAAWSTDSAAASTDPMTGHADTPRQMTGDETDAGLVAPIGRTRSPSGEAPARRRGVPGAAIAAGVVALAAVAGAGWYAMRADDGVAELTPGAAQESLTVAEAPMAATATLAAPAGGETSATAPAATTPTSTSTPAAATERRTTVRTASTTRTRPAATRAVSATEAGIDASGEAALPSGPQPYSALNAGTPSGAAGATSAPSAAPAAVPSTPPVAPDPAPTTITPDPVPVTPPNAATPQ